MRSAREGNAIRSRSAWRRLRSALVYGLFLASFPAVTAVVLHARYARAQRAAAGKALGPVPEVDVRTWRLLGHVTSGQPGSFARFSREKLPGTVRVGCFGDSFTFGQEVDQGQDYPALLAKTLHDGGWPQVEVLNFGMPWHGFHQSYLLWERVGQQFDLDYVLLGPAGFQTQRDLTFNHTQDTSPGYLHARYVLDGDGVRQVEVAGETFDERLELYNRLFPPWRYLRYDRRPPAVLRALVAAGSELPNPFYYHHGPARAEALETYRRLIVAMARQVPDRQVVLGHFQPDIVATGRAAGLPNVTAFPIVVPESFPYLAPQGHYSPLGNALVAATFAQALTGGAATLRRIATTDVERPSAPATRGGLERYASTFVSLDDMAVGGFVEANRAASVQRRLLTRLGAVAMVGLQPSGASALDACYVPVAFPLEPGAPLELRQDGAHWMLGALRLLSPDAAIGTVTIDAARVDCAIEHSLAIDLPGVGRGDVEVTLSGQLLLRGPAEGRTAHVKPPTMQLVAIRANPGPFAALTSLPDSGTVWLNVEPRAGPAFRVALARWARSEVPSPARPVPHPLARDRVHAVR